jgi:hypothetical protein
MGYYILYYIHITLYMQIFPKLWYFLSGSAPASSYQVDKCLSIFHLQLYSAREHDVFTQKMSSNELDEAEVVIFALFRGLTNLPLARQICSTIDLYSTSRAW